MKRRAGRADSARLEVDERQISSFRLDGCAAVAYYLHAHLLFAPGAFFNAAHFSQRHPRTRRRHRHRHARPQPPGFGQGAGRAPQAAAASSRAGAAGAGARRHPARRPRAARRLRARARAERRITAEHIMRAAASAEMAGEPPLPAFDPDWQTWCARRWRRRKPRSRPRLPASTSKTWRKAAEALEIPRLRSLPRRSRSGLFRPESPQGVQSLSIRGNGVADTAPHSWGNPAMPETIRTANERLRSRPRRGGFPAACVALLSITATLAAPARAEAGAMSAVSDAVRNAAAALGRQNVATLTLTIGLVVVRRAGRAGAGAHAPARRPRWKRPRATTPRRCTPRSTGCARCCWPSRRCWWNGRRPATCPTFSATPRS